MTITQILNSQTFFTIFIKNDTVFNSLKNKFPDILDETKYIQDQKVREKSKS